MYTLYTKYCTIYTVNYILYSRIDYFSKICSSTKLKTDTNSES